MIIEFPRKYSIRLAADCSTAIVTVPAEYTGALIKLLKQQPWISRAEPLLEHIDVSISRAYDINVGQARSALCQLCEHVMSPPVEVDRDVWGDALGGNVTSEVDQR